jgi:CRP/FNR family cyclic AMP-dependent transcriptional regulator
MAPWALASAHIFSRLPEKLANDLFAKSRLVKIAADQTLFTAGDPGDGCYRVESGLMKVSVISPTGSERILAIFGPGSLIGEFAVIDGQPRSATVTAVRESLLRFISRATYQDFVRQHPEARDHIMMMLIQRLRDTNSIVAAASFLSTKGRVALAMCGLAEAFGQDLGNGKNLIKQKITQNEVAAMAGVARENVSRTLNEWMRQKLISREGGFYRIESRERLEREAES